MIANGIITLPGRSAEMQTVALGAGTAANGDAFVAVIVGSQNGPEASTAGWIMRENATSQTMLLWSQGAGGGAPSCGQSTVTPHGYLPSMNLCFGESGAYPDYIASYSVGGVLPASWWGINGTASALFSVTDAGCSPVSMLSPGTPFGTGAFGLDVQGGGPAAAPAAWAEAPSACGY